MMRSAISVAVMVVMFGVSGAHAQGTPVFNNLPDVVPGNVPSLGFQAVSARELGDEIRLDAGTPRRTGFATLLMSSWALHSEHPTMPAAGYTHPISLSIYEDAAAAATHTPAWSVTQTFTIPWRPEPDPLCAGTAWKSAVDGNCYSGLAFQIVFDLRSLSFDLPSQFIYGVAYDTNTWGYAPIGAPGPYESLNVGLSRVDDVALEPAVGTDVDADVVYFNTMFPDWYTDGGAGGVGTFRADTGWTGYPIGVKFTTFGVPATAADCKNGAWQNLVRADFSAFKNQGECVSYANAQP